MLLQVIYALINQITVNWGSLQYRVYQQFGKVWFQNSTVCLSSYTIAAVPENIFYSYICYIFLSVCLFYYLRVYPDIYGHRSLCFQDSIIDCNTNINSFLVKRILNLC